ncbi:hypothetical protein, partial [Sulfurimonas sp.]|uniref:hypothetical protein n=1 Tax=Sulfurimonas sp. TaxID=2022749 RepID=UPI003D136C4C
MKNFEFCTQDTSDDIAIGFVFLTVNILSFFSVVVLFEIDINLFFALLGIQFLSIAGWKFKKFHKISKWKRVPIVIQHSNILIEQTYSDTGHIKCFLPQIQ